MHSVSKLRRKITRSVIVHGKSDEPTKQSDVSFIILVSRTWTLERGHHSGISCRVKIEGVWKATKTLEMWRRDCGCFSSSARTLWQWLSLPIIYTRQQSAHGPLISNLGLPVITIITRTPYFLFSSLSNLFTPGHCTMGQRTIYPTHC